MLDREDPDYKDENSPEKEDFSTGSGNLMDSRTSHLDDELSEKLELAFRNSGKQQREHDLSKLVSSYSAIDLGHAVNVLPLSGRPLVYDVLPDIDAKVDFIVSADRSTQSVVFKHIDDEEVKLLFDAIPSDEVVWILEEMPGRQYRRVFGLLEAEKAAKIRELQKHMPNSAGRLMTNEFFCFPLDATIGHAAKTIRENPDIDITRSVFVSSKEGELIGYVPARYLIVNPSQVPLKRVMQPILHTIGPEASREEVVDLVERYKIPALPVVDSNNLLVGVVTYEDVVEVMEDIADETIARMAGTAEEVGEDESFFTRFFSRSPWLIVTLLAGLVNSENMAFFEKQVGTFVLFYVPLITGMSGNVGIQCSTVLVRGMATGELSMGRVRSAVTRELGLGTMTGVIFGLICGLAVFVMNLMRVDPAGITAAEMGLIVSVGLVGACMTATTLGVISPLSFAKLGIDPAVASGPIITAFNDVASALIYFVIVKGMATLFL